MTCVPPVKSFGAVRTTVLAPSLISRRAAPAPLSRISELIVRVFWAPKMISSLTPEAVVPPAVITPRVVVVPSVEALLLLLRRMPPCSRLSTSPAAAKARSSVAPAASLSAPVVAPPAGKVRVRLADAVSWVILPEPKSPS